MTNIWDTKGVRISDYNTLKPLTNEKGKQYRCNNRRVYLLIDANGEQSFIMANKHHRWNEYLFTYPEPLGYGTWKSKWNTYCQGFGLDNNTKVVYSNLQAVRKHAARPYLEQFQA